MSVLFFTIVFSTNLSNPEQSGRRGKIAWSEIRTDPESLINPRFLLKAKLSNPTRMTLKDITAYWNHWASKGSKSDPFAFRLDSSSNRGKEGNSSGKGKGKDVDEDDDEDDDEDEDIAEKLLPPDHHDIDDDIPLPSQCKTPRLRTNCLQKLVPGSNEINKSFHRLVKMVDALKVSSVLHA